MVEVRNCQLWENSREVKVPESRYCSRPEGGVPVNPFNVKVSRSTYYKVTPLPLCAEHRHLYLVVVDMGTFQAEKAIVTSKTEILSLTSSFY